MLLNTNTEQLPQIFETIQGEGIDAGMPAFFIRLQGCSVHCFFCDEKETWVKRENNSTKLNPEEILEELEIRNSLLKRVVITGGEPTEQDLKPLINLLIKNSYKVSIETAATGEHTSDVLSYDHKDLSITFSPKEIYSKSSVIQDEKIWAQCDEIKFVVASQEATEYLLTRVIPQLATQQNNCPIYLVPDWYNFDSTRDIILGILKQYPGKFRLGVQLHKLVDLP